MALIDKYVGKVLHIALINKYVGGKSKGKKPKKSG